MRHEWQFAVDPPEPGYIGEAVRHCARCGCVERLRNGQWLAMNKADCKPQHRWQFGGTGTDAMRFCQDCGRLDIPVETSTGRVWSIAVAGDPDCEAKR